MMRYKWLLMYWLAAAVSGAAAFFIPVAGWALGAGAFTYLTWTIPGWLLTGGLYAGMEQRNTVFGIDNMRFTQLLAGAAVLGCGAGLAFCVHPLAWGGASLLYLSGEWLVIDRLANDRLPRVAM